MVATSCDTNTFFFLTFFLRYEYLVVIHLRMVYIDTDEPELLLRLVCVDFGSRRIVSLVVIWLCYIIIICTCT